MPCRAFPQTYPMWEVRIGFYIWVGCKSSGSSGFCAAVALSGSKACHSFLYRLSGGNRPKGGGAASPLGGSTRRASQPAQRARSAGQGGRYVPRLVGAVYPPVSTSGRNGGLDFFLCVPDELFVYRNRWLTIGFDIGEYRYI